MEINGHELEYFDDGHIYLVDGIQVPSITEMLKVKFGHKYDGIPTATLNKAAERGTRVHASIEDYVHGKAPVPCEELTSFKFLEFMHRFKVVGSEIMVILFSNGEPIAAGRLDLVLSMHGEIGGADIKTTSVLDKEYLFYQLNMYRTAYIQSYGVEWTFLKGIHLRRDKRKMVDIPIDPSATWEIVEKWRENE